MPIVIPSAGSSTAITGSGRGSSGSAIVSPIVISGMPGERDDLAGPGLVGGHALEPLGHVQLGRRDTLATEPSRRHHATCWPCAIVALVHAAQREPADVGVGVEVGHARLQRVPLLVLGRRHGSHQQLEQRPQVGPLDLRLESTPSPPSRSCRRSGTRSAPRRRPGRGTARRPRPPPRSTRASGRSTLFTHEHHRQPRLERLAQHEARLRQRPLGGVHQQHHAVDHRQPALHLAAEVGVAGRVDEVDLHARRSARPRSWRGS